MINQQILRNRTKYFAIEIYRFLKNLTKSYEDRIIAGQLLRSSSSVASNYRAACRSRSEAEFYAKICIVLEEADETLFWLEVILEAELANNPGTIELLGKATEFVKIFSSMRKKLKDNRSGHQ
jgi:four helix bundle protein